MYVDLVYITYRHYLQSKVPDAVFFFDKFIQASELNEFFISVGWADMFSHDGV